MSAIKIVCLILTIISTLMEISPEFYTAFKEAYDSKQFAIAGQLVLNLFNEKYPAEMASGVVDEELVDMYLSVLEEQKIDIKTGADVDLYILEPAREKLFGIEDDDDDWSF